MSQRIVVWISLLGFPLCAQEASRKPSPFPEKNREREAAAKRSSSRSKGPVRTKAAEEPAASPAANTGKACFFAVKPGVEDIKRDELVASHATYPLNSRVTVTNLANKKSVVVRITGRFSDPQRIISVSEAVARELGFYEAGTTEVKLDPVREGGPPGKR